MAQDHDPNEMRELAWRTKALGEQARLRAWIEAHPEAQEELALEVRLTNALGRLADAPLSSNFTARVLQEVERERAVKTRPVRARWHFWLPRLAFGAVIVCAGFAAIQHTQQTRRLELARSVAAVSEVASLPSPQILRDFDAIRALSPAQAPDLDLLAALQ